MSQNNNAVAILKKNVMLIVLILVYCIFVVWTKGGIFAPMQFTNLITQNAYVYILACGMLMCMLTGGNIDLSCGSFVCLISSIGALMMVNYGVNTGVAMATMLLIGVAYGCLLGFLIAYVNIPPWIATLAGYLAFRGLGTSILSRSSSTNSISVNQVNSFTNIFSGQIFKTKASEFNWVCMGVGIAAAAVVVIAVFATRASRLKKGYEADSAAMALGKSLLGAAAILVVMWKLAQNQGIPVILVWVTVVVLIYSFITSKTTIGRHFYVVGGNKEAARLSGVNTRGVMFTAYLNMAVITVISAWTMLAKLRAASSTMGTGYEMDAIAACVVGGVSASGGSGSIIGMVIGATLIGVINLGMNLVGIDANFQKVVKGVVLLGAVAFDILSKKRES